MRGLAYSTFRQEFRLSGFVGGWLVWVLTTSLVIAGLCILISLATRQFFSGAALVLVTMSLAFLIVLLGVAAGMAQSDFRLEIVVPYALLAMAIAAAWLLGMKARAHRS